jgi:uncharacterized protein (TIGR03083 family)
VTTPPYAELVSAVRREGEALLTAASQDHDAPVPTCGDWTIADLTRHVWQVYANVSLYVSSRATERPDKLPEIPDGDPVELLRDQLDELVTALSESEADTPIWTWVFDAPGDALFWARRMAHESSVHRFDAQNAFGVRQPIDAELAADGLDELIDVVARRIYTRDNLSGPTGSVVLESSDAGAWCFNLEPDGISRVDVLSNPDVAARGTSSILLLAAYGRTEWSNLEVTGDLSLLESWSAAMHF